MQFSCYIEINILCMILMGIFLLRLHRRRLMLSTADKVMVRLLIAVCVMCVADVVAIVSRGGMFNGARLLVEGSNVLYLLMMPVISKFWCDYSLSKIGREIPKKYRLLFCMPLVMFGIAVLLNPVHHFFFSVNTENLYVRGPGIFVHWIVSWFYFIWAGVTCWWTIRGEDNWIRRSEYRPYLTFLILPAIGSIAQMLLYGVTSVQAGITLSLVLVSLQTQDNQNSTDELTGCNNRTALKRYVDTLVGRDEPEQLTVMMIDVNHFKHINDTYGHSCGDLALRDIAGTLFEVCGKSHERLFLGRYGGDEFVILGMGIDRETTAQIKKDVQDSVVTRSQSGDRPYKLSVSVGCASGICRSQNDFEHYLRLADENMYEEKHQLKAEG